MNEELKTTAQMLDEALTESTDTIEVDVSDVELYTPEEIEEEADDKLEIHLASGTSLTMSYESMDWESVWLNNGPTMLNNVLAIMAKARDMRQAPIGDERTNLANEIIDLVQNAFKEMGVPELDYSGFIFETKAEEALLYMEDYVRLVSELVHIAQVEVIMKPTDGMSFDDIIAKLSDSMKFDKTE